MKRIGKPSPQVTLPIILTSFHRCLQFYQANTLPTIFAICPPRRVLAVDRSSELWLTEVIAASNQAHILLLLSSNRHHLMFTKPWYCSNKFENFSGMLLCSRNYIPVLKKSDDRKGGTFLLHAVHSYVLSISIFLKKIAYKWEATLENTNQQVQLISSY